MTHWHLISCKEGREPTIEEALMRLGHEAYAPVELRRWKPAKRARKAEIYRVPLIPRVVFTDAPMDVFSTVPGKPNYNGYFVGFEHDIFGIPWTIPDVQMREFIATHQNWLDRERARLSAGKKNPSKRKWRKLDGAAVGEILQELFGSEQAQEAA